MSIVSIHNMRVYAYHGCLPEEEKVGTEYRIDMDIHIDFLQAAKDDDLSKTADYVEVAQIIHQEMAIRSKLIETVAQRIINRTRALYPASKNIRITLYKINPPAQANLESVSVTLEG
jgi:7,8-dihydroneopterin aldolase/epimerase/oxygenase